MAGFVTKETNDFGEYEITFQTKKKDDFNRVQTLCRSIMDESRNDELIRRGDMIDALHQHYEANNPDQNAVMDDCVMIALKIPTVHEVEGEWIEELHPEGVNPYFARRFVCSLCNDWQTYGKTDYCPNCGKRMKREETL